ncbi:hypothetical protein F2P81_022584 [Scophthalmus maximus]|uniref:Uncharacterized protein n=1 Tax=Scophthalmus maximus TaxID=52904 RepID=A0A6A4RUM7_SCOMX|nr:hypothetical protein F2P81_022584 [Scophthalmus maximus]
MSCFSGCSGEPVYCVELSHTMSDRLAERRKSGHILRCRQGRRGRRLRSGGLFISSACRTRHSLPYGSADDVTLLGAHRKKTQGSSVRQPPVIQGSDLTSVTATTKADVQSDGADAVDSRSRRGFNTRQLTDTTRTNEMLLCNCNVQSSTFQEIQSKLKIQPHMSQHQAYDFISRGLLSATGLKQNEADKAGVSFPNSAPSRGRIRLPPASGQK